jgi:peptide/nickel transport system permease protein
MAVLIALGLSCLLAPVIARYPRSPTLTADVLAGAGQAPSSLHWFGTDALGRDVFTGVLWAGRISMLVGLSAALGSTLLGTCVGAAAGWFGGVVDQLLMRLTDLLLIIPALAVLMVTEKGLGTHLVVIVGLLALLSWHSLARVVRAEFLSLKQHQFIEAARASGARSVRIIRREMLPHVAGVVSVHATLAVGGAILAESTLSFLGFGFQPPASSWGTMVAQSKGAIGTHQAYLVYFPGLAIIVAVLAVNCIGNGLRAAFDPSS